MSLIDQELIADVTYTGVLIRKSYQHRPDGELITEKTFRKFKSILGLIPGAPTSARLGEVIAAGWGFEDHNDLRTYIEQEETSFRFLPEGRDVHIGALMARLSDFGCESAVARDFAATFIALNDGPLFYETPEEYPEVAGGRVIRLDVLSERMRGAVLRFIDEAGDFWTKPAFHFRIQGPDTDAPAGEEEAENYHRLYRRSGGESEAQLFSVDDLSRSDKMNKAVGTEPIAFFEILMHYLEDVVPAEFDQQLTVEAIIDQASLRIEFRGLTDSTATVILAETA